MDISARGKSITENFLKHHGVKGQRWGVRRRRDSSGKLVEVSTTTNKAGQVIKTSGGHNHPTSEDAKRAMTTHQIAKTSGTHALSNQELQDLVNRLNLEQNYSRLNEGKSNLAKLRRGNSAAKDVLSTVKTVNEVNKLMKGR